MKKSTEFNCSIEDMYTVILLAWQYCEAELSSFTAAYPFYTDKYVGDAIAAIEDAQVQFDQSQRNAITKQDRDDLSLSAQECLSNWQTLKTYITNGYTGNTVKNNLEAAGSNFYSRAAKLNWSALRTLLKSSNTFLTANKDDLIARNIMPEAFVTKYVADTATCSKENDDFLTAEVAKTRTTGEKRDNDNRIYRDAMSMMADGKRLFAKQKNIRIQFVFSRLLAKVRKDGTASVSGYVYNANKLPVEGAVIASKDTKYTATTNAKGRYSINRISAESSYTFVVTCPGYTPVEQAVTLKPGIATRVNFELQNIMKKVA